MGRLVDADELKRNVLKWMPKDQSDYMDSAIPPLENLTVSMVMEIDDAPTVDAVPVVHGRWQWISSTYDRIPCEKRYWCSKCHHETITHDSEPWEKFCPNCGAKMDGKDDDYGKAD